MRQMHALKMNLGRRLRNEYAGEGKCGVSREWDIISRRDAEMRRSFYRIDRIKKGVDSWVSD